MSVEIVKNILSMLNGLYSWVGGCLAQFGLLTEPLRYRLENDGFLLVFGSLGMLIVGILLVAATKKLQKSAWDGFGEEVESTMGYYSVLGKLVYYPLVIETVFFCVISGQGPNTAIFQGVVDSKVHYTLYNFMEWSEAPKYFLCFAFLRFILKTAACIIKRRPLKLLRFYVHTIDATIIGMAVGHLFLFLAEFSNEGFIQTLLFLPVQLCMFIVYPITIGLFTAPLVLIAMPLLVPLMGIIFGTILFQPNRVESEADAIGFLVYSNAVLNMLSD